MLSLPLAIYNTLISDAKREFPIEVCGILGGNGSIVTKQYPITPKNYNGSLFFDPKEQAAAMNDLKKTGNQLLAIYHSRPGMLPPPRGELSLPLNPNISYVVISFAGEQPIVRSFHIAENVVTEEAVICP